jgi:multidrug efflux system outer membrane protein
MSPGSGLRLAASLAALVTGCANPGPPPGQDVKLPAKFVETGPWKESPAPASIARGDWWKVFGDPVLDALEEQASANSPRLRAAAARVEQARAVAGIVEAGRYPNVGVSVDVARYEASGNRPDQPSKVPGNVPYASNVFRVPLYASYEIDIWGRLARQIEAADARAEASLAAYQTVLLTLHGEVAQAYFALRVTERELAIVEHNLELRERARQVVLARRREGLASELDVSRIAADVATTQAEKEGVARRRTDLIYSLAVLVGAVPEEFRINSAGSDLATPPIPVGLPSELLERRPDVAEAKQQLISRHAEVGAARVAFYPSIRLTGAIGFESAALSDLVSSDSLIWLIGGQLNQAIFDGGRRQAEVRRARAAYAETLAQYQERLLVALREVEGALAALRHLDAQSTAQARAVAEAERAQRLAQARYRGGLAPLIDVLDAQRVRLASERQQVQLQGQTLTTTVALIKSLGGGWEARGSNPTAANLAPDTPNRGPSVYSSIVHPGGS